MRNRALFAAVVYLSAGTAHAHITLIDPAPRHSAQKSGPCGAGASDERGTVISTYAPGSTITVRWEETVPHPGYFRISFDADGQDDFFAPPTATPSGGDGVLVDAIADKEGTGVYEQQVTLPDVPCDRCTLQLVQVMTDKPPYGDGNDLYFQCADIVLSDDEPATTGATAGDDRLADGCGCNAPATSPLALLVLALVRRQRVSRRETSPVTLSASSVARREAEGVSGMLRGRPTRPQAAGEALLAAFPCGTPLRSGTSPRRSRRPACARPQAPAPTAASSADSGRSGPPRSPSAG